MPCCARESTSLIIFEFVAVSSSSSLMRSRIGWVWRCTYFLRANGLIFPQKPWWLSYCNGALPVAVSPLGVVGDDDACDDWSLVVEFAGCWASAGSERTNATNNATTARFFIFDILRGEPAAPCGLARAPHCTPCAGVIAIWCVPGKRGTDRVAANSPLTVPASADA